MINTQTIIASLMALVVGWLFANLRSKNQLKLSQESQMKLTNELESVRSTANAKVLELNAALAEKANSHAAELLEIKVQHNKATHELEDKYRQELITANQKGFDEGFRQAELRNEKRETALTVQVRPYAKKVKKDGLIWDDVTSEVGFQYQLMVNGIPCFQPHIVIEASYEEQNFNQDRAEFLTNKAIEIAKIATQNSLAKEAITFVDHPVIDGF